VYCVIAHLHWRSTAASERMKASTYKKFLKDFVLDGLTFPMHPMEVDQFEHVNSHLKFQINIFVEEDDEVYPYRLPNYEEGKSIINVLLVEGLLSDGMKIYHYILINNPSSFLQKKYFNEAGRCTYGANMRCRKCFASFRSEEKKNTHEEICQTSKPTHLKFFKENKKISYSKPWNGFPQLLCGFVDFESILVQDKGIFPQTLCKRKL